jgi:hypothetical protein
MHGTDFWDHFCGRPAFELYSQILNRTQGQIVRRHNEGHGLVRFLIRFQRTGGFTFDPYIVRYACEVCIALSSTRTAYILQEGHGAWQSPLGTLGFVQVRGKAQSKPEDALEWIEFDVCVSKERLDRPRMEIMLLY